MLRLNSTCGRAFVRVEHIAAQGILEIKMKVFFFKWFFLALFALLAPFVASQPSAAAGQPVSKVQARTYPEMLAAGEIRMAVPYDRSIYVDAKTQKLGAALDISKGLGSFLSAKYKKNIRVTLVPTAPAMLLQSIDNGQSDFIMAYVDEYVDKLDPARYLVYPHPNRETHVVVSAANTQLISNLSELSGQTVCLGRQTQSTIFNDINKDLEKSGKNRVNVYKDHLVLDDEDLLQMLNDGLVQHVLVAHWKATLWQPLLKNIQINQETRSPGAATEGVVLNRQNKGLGDDILEFVVSPAIFAALDVYRTGDFKYREHALKNPTAPSEWGRYISMRHHFERYGPENNLDPLLISALGFQETMLNQNLVSPMGAVGVMQLLPATGSSMKVGNIRELEPNIHAGAKYMNSLLAGMSIDDRVSQTEQGLFAIAAYNAGPNNIRKARELAANMGFDPDKWFLNVEMAAAKMMGLETFLYVRNVYKYYVTYDIKQKNKQINEEMLLQSVNQASR